MPIRILRFALLLVFGTLMFAPPDASARRLPPPQLGVHEWGVWLFDRGVVTIDDLARESPPFVHRASANTPAPPTPTPTPPTPNPWSDPDRPPAPARKPVIFFHAPSALDVVVRVGFRHGTPWLYYPGGAPERLGPEAGLRFTGRVVPNDRSTQLAVARDHFWNHLRAASDSVFRATNGESESFVFYDGPSEVVRPIVATRAGDAVALHASAEASAIDVAYVVDHQRYLAARPAPDASVSLAAVARTGAPTRVLERALMTALRERGLTRAEALSLVRTWHHELFDASQPHVVTILSRTAYDAALPIEISPQPMELVRVGVIIERL